MKRIQDGARLKSYGSTFPTYLYRFAVEGKLGLCKSLFDIKLPGVSHCDDLGYLFYSYALMQDLKPSSPEMKMVDRMD